MRIFRPALLALAAAIVTAAAARPVTASSSYQLCLGLDADPGQYFLNFLAQGSAVLVAGDKGHGGQNDHGPLFGSLSHAPETPHYIELGLTVTFSNAGDYMNPNTENVVFTFYQDGTILYKRWLNSTQAFTQGTATVIACP